MMETAQLCWALCSGASVAAAAGRVGSVRVMMAIDSSPVSEMIVQYGQENTKKNLQSRCCSRYY